MASYSAQMILQGNHLNLYVTRSEVCSHIGYKVQNVVLILFITVCMQMICNPWRYSGVWMNTFNLARCQQ